MSPTAPGPPSTPHYLRAVFGSTFFVRFGFGLTVSIFASYITGRSVGIDPTAVGDVALISAMAPVGEFSTVLLSGSAADRFGRFPVLFVGMALAAALLATVSLTRDPLALAGLNLGFGVASGAILAASLAVVGDRAGGDERGFEMGRFDAMNLLGWILGFSVGFGLLGALPNPALDRVFQLGAAALTAGFGFAALSIGRLREPPVAAVRFDLRRIYRAAFRRSVLLVTLPWLVIYMLLGTLFVFLGSASTGAGLSAPTLALLIGGGGLLLLLTQPFFGRLADRFGRLRLMVVGTVGFVGVLVGGGLLASFGPQLPLLVLVGVSAPAALAYGPAALAALTDLSESLSRATTMALYTLVISLGMLLGLVLSSRLYGRFGAAGLDVFFGGIGAGLVVLTVLRARDVRRRLDPAGV